MRKIRQDILKRARKELARQGGNAKFNKYGREHMSEMGKKSASNRFKGWTKEQISEYFRNIRLGIKVKETKIL